jgi:hypothetical protein
MILLVVGLVAVIVVVLIAVFLSIRLGRNDEDDEPDLRSSGRDRRRDQDEHWQDRDTRRVSSSGSRGGRGDYPGSNSRGPAGGRAPRGRDYDSAPRRPAHEGSDYGVGPSPRRPTQEPASARSAVGASAQASGRAPSRRPAADDFPSADYPSMDFGPGDSFATGDQPSVEFPATVDGPRGRPDSRRKAAPAPASSKSRSRQRGKRDDDDDWPSSEWDKLSDEQYWAELSADKPLSSMARPARPAAKASANGSAGPSPHHPTQAKPKPAARDPRPARPPASDRDLQRDLPGRTDQREPATERLPVRAARQAPPSLPPSRREADVAAAARSYPEPRSVLDSGPRTLRDTGPHQARNTGPHPARDTGPQPRLEPRRRDNTGPQPTMDRDLAMLTGLASAPPPIPGALEDDPLTSPSFSLKAVPASDSRSYSNARKHAKPGPADHAANGAAHANGNGHGANGHSSGGYPAADYADPGYAYHSAPPASPAAGTADWYSAPPASAGMHAEAQTSGYGNPYAHTGSGGGASGAHTGGEATAAYNNYLADPLRVYAPPGHEAPAPYAEPAGYMAAPPPPAGSAPYSDGYPAQPYAEPGYQDGYGNGGYAPGYDAGYPGDPYTSGGYAPYPPQG